MYKLLINKFITNPNDTSSPKTRSQYGKLASWVGIVLNVALFLVKAVIGIAVHSIAIVADATNNLSDASSNIVTLLGFQMSEKPADKEHPFGHGRFEYISGLIVSVIIISVGLELTKTSIDRTLNPQPTLFTTTAVIVLLLSIAVKGWMAYFNNRCGASIDSNTLKASAQDSRNDCITTFAILLCAILSHTYNIQLDGIAGLVIGIFISISGVQLVRDTLNPLLGQTPNQKLVSYIEHKILSYPEVLGTHDLMVHDYGPGRLFASAHVEMAAEVNPLVSHDIIDNIEQDFIENDHIQIVLHYDPIVTNDPGVKDLRHWISTNIKQIHPKLTIHDLRCVPGPTHTNVIFDCVKPNGLTISDNELRQTLSNIVLQKIPGAICKITIDKSYVTIED